MWQERRYDGRYIAASFLRYILHRPVVLTQGRGMKADGLLGAKEEIPFDNVCS